VPTTKLIWSTIEDFERYRLMPRRLVDVGKRVTGIELFGRHQAAVFMIRLTGISSALRPKGGFLLARARERAGIPLRPAASNGDLWFRLYIVQRKRAEQMVRRAEAAGYLNPRAHDRCRG
jgi:(S)-mandelate dehydrogenase